MISSSSTEVSTPTFVTIQKDQDNADFTSWDGITKFQNAPSKSAHKMVSVLGDHYKYKFTKEELFKLTSKINAVKSASLVKGDSNESALQSHLIIEPSSNDLRFNIDSCTVTINFDQPVLQTGENEFRPFVNCACCGGCSCAVTIPQELRELVANATINTITMFGLPPDYFHPAETQYPFWRAFFSYGCPTPESGGVPCTDPFILNAEIFYFPETGCLSTSGFYTEWNSSPQYYPGISLGLQAFGDGQFCEDQQYSPTQNGTFTINGEGAYNYYYFTGIDPNTGLEYPAVPPPNFVFT